MYIFFIVNIGFYMFICTSLYLFECTYFFVNKIKKLCCWLIIKYASPNSSCYSLSTLQFGLSLSVSDMVVLLLSRYYHFLTKFIYFILVLSACFLKCTFCIIPVKSVARIRLRLKPILLTEN